MYMYCYTHKRCVCVFTCVRERVCVHNVHAALPFYQSTGMEWRPQGGLMRSRISADDLECAVLTTVKCFHGDNAVHNHVHVLCHKENG